MNEPLNTTENTSLNSLHIIQYLSKFITRAFLIAILCFMCLFGAVLMLYLGDLLVNSHNGTYKNPLFSAYVIVSESMVPTIKINDAIVVKRDDHDQYNVGDIITFESSDVNYEGLTVTHRIVDKEGIGEENSVYTTKGDNNSIADPAAVYTNSIYGKVLFKIPKVGYVEQFFSKPTNFFICLLIPAVIFIVYELTRIGILMTKRKEMI